jgi:hypothetical protein
MKHFVYKTYNPINKKFYIGRHSTNNVDDGYQGSGLWVKRSIKKGNNLKTKILEFADNIDQLCLLEEKYIKKYHKHSKNTNGKLSSTGMTSEDMKGEKNPRYGSKEQAEMMRKLGLANKGKKHTQEHIDKTRRPGKLNGMYGVKRTGANNPNYKGGITKDPNYQRDYWRKHYGKSQSI